MLRITLAINADTLGDFEVKRVTNNGSGPGDANMYEVRDITDGTYLGGIWHSYGRGPYRLARSALSIIVQKRPYTGDFHPVDDGGHHARSQVQERETAARIRRAAQARLLEDASGEDRELPEGS